MARSLSPCKQCGGKRTYLDIGLRKHCMACWGSRAVPPNRDGFQKNASRAVEMVDLHKFGWTLQEIGSEYGVTRERVRQIIGVMGQTSANGGMTKRAATRREGINSINRQKRDARSYFVYGCSHQEALEINSGVAISNPGHPAHLYVRQRENASKRGVRWEITFPQWWRVWQDSGHWQERGLGADKYCMARKNDTGPYSISNIYIATCSQNIRDYRASLRQRGVICPDGYMRLPEKRNKADGRPPPPGRGWWFDRRSTNRPYKVMQGGKYVGTFATQAEAEAAYKAAREAKYGLLKTA